MSYNSLDVENIIEQALEKKKKIFKKNKKLDPISYNDIQKYKIVEKFLKLKGLKIYGGFDINSRIGQEDKFYKDDEIPDYDVYSPDPWNDAVELANMLYSKGFLYTEVKQGIHYGTYKVYSNLFPVADITYIKKEMYEKIPTIKIKGLNICSPTFLNISMLKNLMNLLKIQKDGQKLQKDKNYWKNGILSNLKNLNQ